MKKILLITLTLLAAFLWMNNVFAENLYGADIAAGKAGIDTKATDVPAIIGTVAGTAFSIMGVLFFALMIYGGFVWMLARGNEEDTKKALHTITAAVTGLIILFSAYTITYFLFNSFAETKITPCTYTTGCKDTEVCKVKDGVCVPKK